MEKAGISAEVTYTDFGAFDEIQAGFSTGTLHAFFSAAAPAIKLRSDRQDIRIVEIGCSLQQEVLVRTEIGVSSVSQLRNKRIAVAEGTSSHYGLLKILSAAGIDQTEVTLMPGFPGDAQPLFESKSVDAWAVWPPFPEKQIIAGRGVALAGGDAKILSVMSLHRSVIDQNPLAAEALVSAVQRSKKWIAENPEEAQSISAQRLSLDLEVVQLAWPKHNWGATITDSVLRDMQDKSIFLTEQGVVVDNQVVDVEQDLVDLRYALK